ncbi:putative serine/threonine protein kinase IREH1 [Vitis vinifera]|uniref:non-specific serine/threonine protein kinase n=1 Tax=Vitis vinifera TaxID=29760 RepID=A0A438EXL0_VITVI|nr:putative serine/threonine protein kinase IREH1 [Vitis vinifera]
MIRKNAVESILAERDILISVRNPFVVRFFYSFTCRENLYLVMEYLNGGDLYSLLRSLGCLDEDVARIYIAEVVLALEYLHSLRVVHRDLKPDNLLIAHDETTNVIWFGFSRVVLDIKDEFSLLGYLD